MESKDLEVINGTGKTPFQEWAEKYKNGQINMQASASTENMIAFARSIPVPTAREQHEMAVKAKLGDREARDLLILASLRLGIIVAQQMELNLKNNIEDYIQKRSLFYDRSDPAIRSGPRYKIFDLSLQGHAMEYAECP